MFNRSTRKFDKGFTLIELLVTIAIIGTLAAIAIPMYASQQQSASKATAQADGRAFASSLATAFNGYSNLGTTSAAITLSGTTLSATLTAGASPSAGAVPTTVSVSSGTTVSAGSTQAGGTGWCLIVSNNGQRVGFTQAGLSQQVQPSTCSSAGVLG